MLECHYFPLSKCVECMQCGWSTVWQNVKRVLQQYRVCVIDLLGLANVDSRERSFILFKLADRVNVTYLCHHQLRTFYKLRGF